MKKGSFTQPASDNQAQLRVYTLRACILDPAVHDAQVADLQSGSFVIRLMFLDTIVPSNCRYNALGEKHLDLDGCTAQD